MKFRTCERYCSECGEGAFHIQPSVCDFNFPNKTSCWEWAWHDLLNFLTVNLRDYSFHNYINWSGFHLQVHISPLLWKTFTLKVLRWTENCICDTFPSPWHDLIIGPSMKKNPPNKLSNKTLSPDEKIFLEESPSLHSPLVEGRWLPF